MSFLNNRNFPQMCSRFPDQNMVLGNFVGGSPVMQPEYGQGQLVKICALTKIDLAEFVGVSLDIVGDFGIDRGELQFAVMHRRRRISHRYRLRAPHRVDETVNMLPRFVLSSTLATATTAVIRKHILLQTIANTQTIFLRVM